MDERLLLNQERLSLGASVLTFHNAYFKNMLDLALPQKVHFTYSDELSKNEVESYGLLQISSSYVTLTGLRLCGSLLVVEGSGGVVVENCHISGSVRINRNCSRITFKNCVFRRCTSSTGFQIMHRSDILLENCVISDYLVGIAVLAETRSTCDDKVNRTQCVTSECCFSRNTTDVLIQLECKVAENQEVGYLDMSKVLEVNSSTSLYSLKFDVSLSGRFEPPLSFKKWPLDSSDIPAKLKRRGFKSSPRYCHLSVCGGKDIEIREDTAIEASSRDSRKPNRSTGLERFTKAEIYYSKVLSLLPGASRAEVLAAYKKLALALHPDKTGATSEKFIEIKAARDELLRIKSDK